VGGETRQEIKMDKYKFTITYEIGDHKADTYPHTLTTMREAVTLLAGARALLALMPAYLDSGKNDPAMQGVMSDVLWSLPVDAEFSPTLQVFSTTLATLAQRTMETGKFYAFEMFAKWLSCSLPETLADFNVNVTGYWAEDEEDEEE
jgi:hypothetical protein